ncbi:unnamed protein product [Prorocentrum cordatum]|uniref:Uncharacterized protein n=1 Tax=Prorocentrum cordatum TaxID=2364126 RepID=A0ABN9RR11_9DINO|nr:unnamed protein product [Polarella glacialis]
MAGAQRARLQEASWTSVLDPHRDPLAACLCRPACCRAVWPARPFGVRPTPRTARLAAGQGGDTSWGAPRHQPCEKVPLEGGEVEEDGWEQKRRRRQGRKGGRAGEEGLARWQGRRGPFKKLRPAGRYNRSERRAGNPALEKKRERTARGGADMGEEDRWEGTGRMTAPEFWAGRRLVRGLRPRAGRRRARAPAAGPSGSARPRPR